MPAQPAEMTDQDRSTLIQQVSAAINNVTAVPLSGLLEQTSRFGNFNVQHTRAPLTRAHTLAGELGSIDLGRLPVTALQNLQECLGIVSLALSRLQEFRPSAGEAAYNDLIRTAREADERLAVVGSPWIAYAFGRDRAMTLSAHTQLQQAQNQIQNAQNEARNLQLALENIVSEGQTALQKAQQDAKRILAEMRAASAKTGVSTHAKAFGDAARRYGGASWFWMAATVVVAVLSVVSLARWLHEEPLKEAATNAVIAQYVLTRSVILLFGVFLTVWAARNYRAQRHLFVLNDHRARALDTFGTFINSTADDATKDAILLETTRSIFSAGATGYLGGGEEDSGADRLFALAKILGGGSKDH